MLVLAALQSWRGGSPSMADAMMQQARPLSGCAGAGAVVVPSMAGGGSSPKLARW